MVRQKILLAYIGNEQGAWGTIAFPRPAHYYIMPGILYCAQALLKSPWITERYDIQYRFFNSDAQSQESMVDSALSEQAQCVGISVYCWNRDISLKFARGIRQKQPQTFLLCGGPEITQNTPEEAGLFFEQNPCIDLLVFGDAEIKLAAIVQSALSKAPFGPGLGGYALNPRCGAAMDFTLDHIERPQDVPRIFPFRIEVARSLNCGLAMVYETSRGCPYRCIYCQFGHRANALLRMPLERVREELSWLLSEKIDCIHFADAVFDMNPDFAKNVLVHCIAENRSTSLFFYCSFLKLDEELAALLSRSQAQICVGVQSVDPLVLRRINRNPNPELFLETKELLGRFSINFYVDLIFGLPLDTEESFLRSVNAVHALDPAFIMLFPLSLIGGTPLQRRAQEYGMRSYDEKSLKTIQLVCDIEYRNIALYKNFSLIDLERFDDLALAIFYFYNRFRLSLAYLSKRLDGGAAALFEAVGRETKVFLRARGIRATNANVIDGFEDVIKSVFIEQAKGAGAQAVELAAFEELFKLDIFRILVADSPHREKLFKGFKSKAPVAENIAPMLDTDSVRRIAHGKIVYCNFRLSDLNRLHELRESIGQGNRLYLRPVPSMENDRHCFNRTRLFSIGYHSRRPTDTLRAISPCG
jgi:radical SAM superfamily enzyme YgiQ (UPF0313 family)